MRVVEPKKQVIKRRIYRKRIIFLFVVTFVIILSILGILLTQIGDKNPTPNANPKPEVNKPITNEETSKRGTMKILTGEEFKNLYNRIAYPNTKSISDTATITGNILADEHIKNLALSRGYLPRSEPVANVFVDVDNGFVLQERAASAWNNLKSSAQKSNISLGLVAAYRSADDQRELFLNKIGHVSAESITAGTHDSQILSVLKTTAIPGFSRHHTGYTIDISCINDPLPIFKNSVCYKWLSNNNYENAKISGWIPSYPDGAGQQGPEPEPWEYVWVGKETLQN